MGDNIVGAKEIQYAGFLIKQGKIIKNWKQRWFEVDNEGVLKYYKQSPGEKFSVPGSQSGTIDLTKCSETVKGANVEGKSWPTSNVASCFSMIMPHRTYYLVARSQQEADDWTTFIDVFKGKSDGNETPVEYESEEEEEEEQEPDTFSCLSSALMANADVEISRSNSVARGRVDTDRGMENSEESDRIAKHEVDTLRKQK